MINTLMAKKIHPLAIIKEILLKNGVILREQKVF